MIEYEKLWGTLKNINSLESEYTSRREPRNSGKGSFSVVVSEKENEIEFSETGRFRFNSGGELLSRNRYIWKKNPYGIELFHNRFGERVKLFNTENEIELIHECGPDLYFLKGLELKEDGFSMVIEIKGIKKDEVIVYNYSL